MSEIPKYVFIKDSVLVYKAVEIAHYDKIKDEVEVIEINNKNAKIARLKISDTYPIASLDELNSPPPDLIKLMIVNLPGILNSLRHRFERDWIYTSVGPILVALNPFKWVKGIYDEDVMMRYFHEEIDLSSDPHVFAISNEAFQGLKDRFNQSLVISGESGAGKTETTKQCLNYLAKIAGSSSGVQNKILLASPILEAWGNAKTLRNNNSSRFGKFIEIWFDKDYSIVGSSNTTYLLEKSRVVFQDQGERNYHVFYQLLQGADASFIRALHLEEMKRYPESVAYINQSGCISIEDVNDARDYDEVQHALLTLGFSPTECQQLWTVIATVLHLGNIEYGPNPKNSDEAIILASTQHHLDISIELIGVDPFILTQSLLTKKIQTGGKRASISFSPYTVPLAIENRNSLVKEMYNRTFDWIVSKINTFVNSGPTATREGMIGVLDIFGFEIFKKNSFEQLCINLANEALQQHFNFNIFRVEMELYRSEDIPIPELSFNDNQDVLDLIMKRPNGIIPVLDEEGMVPRGSWEGFLSKIIKNHHPGNKRFKNKQLTKEFSVVHYAGEVTYDPKLFLAKNKDTLAQEIVDELATSQVELISTIFRMDDPDTTPMDSPVAKRSSTMALSTSNKMTIGKKFSVQLESLIGNLNSTKPHYIRCIKPNDVKKPDIFMPNLTNEQLTYSGVFEAVIILQSGYPFRLNLFEFRERFHLLILHRDGRNQIFGPKSKSYKRSPPINLAEAATLRQQCGMLVSLAIKLGHTMMTDSYLGKTKVFYRAPVHYYLVRMRNEILAKATRNMQRYCRGYMIRKLYRLIRIKVNECAKSMFARDMKAMTMLADVLDDLYHRMNKVTPPIINIISNESNMARKLYQALLVEIEVVDQLKKKLSNRAAIFDEFDDILNAVNKAKAVISFRGMVNHVELSHTWQQNSYLVEVDRNVTYWEHLVSMKKEIQRAIRDNDELSLESMYAEVEDMKKQGALDGVVDISDVVIPMEIVIKASRLLSDTFISDTMDIYKSSRIIITGSDLTAHVDNIRTCESSLLRLNYTMNDEELIPIITYYSQSTSDIEARTKSRRVKDSVRCYHHINHMRTLMKFKSWNKLWHVLPIWKNLVKELVDDAWIVPIVDIHEEISHPSVQSAYEMLLQVSAMTVDDVEAIHDSLVSLLREEVVNMIRVCISILAIPKLLSSLSQALIPAILYLNPTNSRVDTSELTTALDQYYLLNPIFNPHLRRIYNTAKEHLQLRNAMLTGQRMPIFTAIREVMNIPIDDSDRVNASAYETLYRSYEQAKVSVFEDGVCVSGKQPGFLDLICDPNPLIEALLVLKELKVEDDHWIDFMKIATLLQVARSNCMSRTYDKAASEIIAAFSKAWWMGLSSLGSISSVSSSDGSNATIVEAILYAKHELKLMLVELKHRLAIATITVALTQGRVIGTLARLDYSDVNDTILSTELAKYRHDIVASTSDARILVDCDTLVLIRQYLMAQNWTAVGDLMQQTFKSTNAFHDCHEATQSEFTLCYHGYLDRSAMKRLEVACSSNQIILTANNDVDILAYVDIKSAFESLNEAIRQAEGLQFRSDECSLLLDSAKKLHALRMSVRTDNWERWKFRSFNIEKLSMDKLMEEISRYSYLEKDADYVINGLLTPLPRPSKLNFATACVEDILALVLQEMETLHPLLHQEFINAHKIVQERRCRSILLVAALCGQIGEKLGSFDMAGISYKVLTKAILHVKAMNTIFSEVLSNWIAASEQLLHIRIAVMSWNPNVSDSIIIEDYIDTSHLSGIMISLQEPFPHIEFDVTISVVIDTKNFNLLVAEFDTGRPLSYVENFNIQSVNYENMLSQLNVVKKLNNRSDRIDRLMFFADLCVHLRRALILKRWDSSSTSTSGDRKIVNDAISIDLQSVKQCLEEYKRAIKFFSTPIIGLPPKGLVEDIALIEIEYARRNLVQSFNLAFQDGRISGKPLALKLNRIRYDSIKGIIERVNTWKAEVKEIGSELSLLMNAAIEIQAIRSEALQIQSEFACNKVVVIPVTDASGVDLTQFISQYIAQDAMKSTNMMMKSYTNNHAYISTQWKKIEAMLPSLTYSRSIIVLSDELSLLTAETFARNYVAKMSSMLYKWDQHNISNHLQAPDEKFANESLQIIYQSCEAYMMQIDNRAEFHPDPSSVLHEIYKSSILLYYIIIADIRGLYDIPRRDWKHDGEVVSLSIDKLKPSSSSSSSSSYSMQSLIRACAEYPRSLHYAITNLMLTREKYIDDMISHEEMHTAISSTSQHLIITSDDSEDVIDPHRIDTASLQYVKDRMDSVGVTESSISLMRSSFELILNLRLHLQSNTSSSSISNFTAAYSTLDTFLCGGRRDVFEILRYVTSPKSKYPIHMFIQTELGLMIKYIIDNYIRQLLEDALAEGFITGKRLQVDISSSAWKKLDLVVKYGEFNFPWSSKTHHIMKLCHLVRSYRKSTSNLDIKLIIESISPIITQEIELIEGVELPKVAANYPSQDLRKVEIIASICCEFLESIHASQSTYTCLFAHDNMTDMLIMEAEMLLEHMRLMINITLLIYNASTRVLEYSEGGLVVHLASYHSWKVACDRLHDANLNPNDITEKWYYSLYQHVIHVLSIVETMISISSQHPNHPISIDLETLSLDQRLSFPVKDIEALLRDITNVNRSVSEVPITVDIATVTIDKHMIFLSPGSSDYGNVVPLINTILEHSTSLITDFEVMEDISLSMSLAYLHYALESSITEHNTITDMRNILSSHEIINCIDEDTGICELSVIDKEAINTNTIILQEKLSADDNIAEDRTFPWLSSWLNTGLSLTPSSSSSSTFTQDFYYKTILFLSSKTNLTTTVGKLYRTVTRLYIELRWCAVCNDWSRGQVISYVLSHLTLMNDDISIPDAYVFRSFVDILTLKRRLEYGIISCRVYPVVGWSTSIDHEKFLLLLNDYELMETLHCCETSFAELCSKDQLLQPLMKIAKVVVKIISRMRSGHWGSNRLSNEFNLLKKLNKENKLSLNELVRYIEQQQDDSSTVNASSLKFLLSELKDMISSSLLTVHPLIKSFLSSQIELIEKEVKHRELMVVVAPLMESIEIKGRPGNLIITSTCINYLDQIIQVLSSPSAEDSLSYSLDLIRIKQSATVVYYLIQEIIQDQTCDEVEVAIAVMKHMSKLPSYHIIDACYESSSNLLDGKHLRDFSDVELYTSYEHVIHTATYGNSQCLSRYLEHAGDPHPHNIPIINREKVDDHIVMLVSGGSILADLLPLHLSFISMISLCERNVLYLRLYQGFVLASSSGSAIGTPAELITTSIDYETLDNISTQLLLYCFVNYEDGSPDSTVVTPYAILYRATIFLRQLRYAQLRDNMEQIKLSLTAIEKALITEFNHNINKVDNKTAGDNIIVKRHELTTCLSSSVVGAEIVLASEDWEQRYLISKLQASLQSSGIPIVDSVDSHGLPTDTSFLEVDVEEFHQALKLCDDYLPSPSLALQLRHTVETMLEIRMIYRKKDWTKLAGYINETDMEALVTCALPEIIRAKRAAFVYEALSAVSTSYSTGCFMIAIQIKKVEPTEDDLIQNVQIESLQNAYDLLSRVHESWRTSVIHDHLDACRSLLSVRREILDKNWPAVYDIASMILNPSRIEVKHTFDEVISEIQLAKDYASEVIVQKSLKKSIAEGKVTGEIGALNLVQLSTSHLLAAINLAVELRVKGKETLRILNTAKIAARLRVAQSRDYWISKGQQDDETSAASKSKFLPPEVEHAIVKYGKMTVEAAIVEAETLVGSQQKSYDAQPAPFTPPTPKSSAWIKRMFPGQNPTSFSSNIKHDDTKMEAVTDPSTVNRAQSSSKTPSPLWMQALDFLPEEERHSIILNPSEKKIESVEDIIHEIENKNNMSISPDIYDEIAIARDELRYRRVVFSLLVGLRSQGPAGLPGALDISTINTSTLSQVIAYAEQYPTLCNKSRCKYLLRDAKFLVTARLKRLQGEWKRLQKIIDAVKELNALTSCPACSIPTFKITGAMNNQPPSPSAASPITYHPIFQPVWEELRIYDADLSFQLCLASFAEEMNRKIEYKSPSSLGGGSIDMTPVLPLIENTRATKAAALIYPSTEYDRLIEAQTLAIELRVRRVYEPNKSTRDLMEKTNIIRTRDARMQLPSFVSFLLTDVTHMSTATDKQQQIQALELAIVSGQQYIRSPIGRINPQEIDVSTLQIVIQTAGPLLKTIGSRSDLHLVEVANAIIKVRKALSTGDWIHVRKAIQDHHHTLQADIVHEEIDRILVEADNIDACHAFQQVFRQGRYIDVVKIAKLIYRPKRKRLQSMIDAQYLNDVDDINTESSLKGHNNKPVDEFQAAMKLLESLIESTKLLSIRSDDTNTHLKAGELTLRMRTNMMQGHWDEVKEIVFTHGNDGLLPDVVLEEIRAVRHGLSYRDVITKIADAMLHGAVSGSPGDINLSTVDYTSLQEALNASDVSDLHDTNGAMKIMYEFASKLCDIRRAIKESRWSLMPISLFPDQELESGSYNTSLKTASSQNLMSTHAVMPDITEAVNSFMQYEHHHIEALKQLLQISDDEDNESSDENNDDDNQPSNNDNQTFVPFLSSQPDDKHLLKQHHPTSIESDWLVHQWEAVKAAKREVKLVLWEIKEKTLREKLIQTIENIPSIALRFTSSQNMKNNHNNDHSNNTSRRDDFFLARHNNILNSKNNSNQRSYLHHNLNANHYHDHNRSDDNNNDPMHIESLKDVVRYVLDQYSTSDVISEDVNLLLSTAKILLKFRRAIMQGVDLNEYKLLVEEATELRDRGKMSESVGIVELRAYMSASMTVEIIRNELIKALMTGKAKGFIDDIDTGSIETQALSYWLSSSNILAETAQDLAIGLIPIVKEAEILLHIRTCVKLGSWHDLHSLWKSLFNTRGVLREDVSFTYIQAEVYHINAAHRLRDLIIQLDHILNEYFDADLENHYSLLMVKSVHLGSILGQLKQLFSYSSSELMPSHHSSSNIEGDNNIASATSYDYNSNLPIHPSNKAIKLFECGQVVVHFWSAVCHRYWGDDLLASGDLDNISLPEDPLLHAVMTRFIQDNLSSSALQAASSNLKNYSSQPSSLIMSLTSAQTFVETFHQVGSSENQYAEPKKNIQAKSKQHPSTRRISISMNANSGNNSVDKKPLPLPSPIAISPPTSPPSNPSKLARRSSVADAYKECRRNSTHNVRLQSTIFHQRTPSIFKSIDRPRMSVLEILATSVWKDYPPQIHKQFDAARNIVIDRALRLRLISCCSTGEIHASHDDDENMGNLIVPDLNDSLELLHMAMTDETIISEEAIKVMKAGRNTVHLSWSSDTIKWLRTAKILLSCRSAVVDQRIDDLVSELVSAGFGGSSLGYRDMAADFICEVTIPEFRVMESFAIESIAEQSIHDAMMMLLSYVSSIKILPVSLLSDSKISKLVDMKVTLLKRLNVTIYYKLLTKLAMTLLEGIEGAIVGNQYQVLRAKEALSLAPTIPPYPLHELKDDMVELCRLLGICAINASNSVPVILSDDENEDEAKEVDMIVDNTIMINTSSSYRASFTSLSRSSSIMQEPSPDRRLTWPVNIQPSPSSTIKQSPNKEIIPNSSIISRQQVDHDRGDHDISEADDRFILASTVSSSEQQLVSRQETDDSISQAPPFKSSMLRSLFGSM